MAFPSHDGACAMALAVPREAEASQSQCRGSCASFRLLFLCAFAVRIHIKVLLATSAPSTSAAARFAGAGSAHRAIDFGFATVAVGPDALANSKDAPRTYRHLSPPPRQEIRVCVCVLGNSSNLFFFEEVGGGGGMLNETESYDLHFEARTTTLF